jgi:indolepyruvate ferredoxin oxidoreductase
MTKAKISLDDKYALDTTRAYITGIEALVRLPILQHQRDLEAGLNTAGFISGYRGSPVGGVDQALWKAQSYLDKHNVHFQPGINEDLAATSVWGSQQVELFKGAKYDGVFALWYGKGPGVDRSMDVIKHANAFGTSKYGGVLAVAGDDHACKSSTLPHQSEHMFIGASVPVLSPSNVQEVLDLGIFGWELSRYSGCWVALKAITENMDSAISAEIDPHRVNIIIPDDFEMPPEGLNARWPATPLEQERILNQYRIYAARNFARVNNLNKIVIDSPNPRLGIITAGKSYLDVLQAMDDLGIDDNKAKEIGLRVYKPGMTWPLEPIMTHEFAKGLEEILVVEEKRSIIEDQLTGQLYNRPVAERPRVIGEFDEEGNSLLSNLSELTPAMIARVIAARIAKFYDSQQIRDRLTFLENKERALASPRKSAIRSPHYCSGCPHNTSTKVPEGSRAFAGIGCHYMAQWMDRDTETFTQMGGEGCTWIGQAAFTDTKHVFQNLGDGTYFHSGSMAIRASIASGVNITYKILYNDAVAMTGGQPVDGQLSVDKIVNQLRSEGVKRIAVVSDDPKKYPSNFPSYEGLTIDHRDSMNDVQVSIREVPGTTAIIYDQTCAAEKRRRRKKEILVDPPKRIFINDEVCEGCGDCSVASNCLSVLPLETELGRKRHIDQDACNKDYSCLKGFCPSFVSVEGGSLRKTKLAETTTEFAELPVPTLLPIGQPWNVLITGIGGTGVLTIGSILAMAAHIDGKGCSTLNQTGLAQKFGAVVSHIRIAQNQQDIHAVRIPAGDADLMIGCDLAVSVSEDALAKIQHNRTHAVINAYEATTSAFVLNPDAEFPAQDMHQTLLEEVDNNKISFIDSSKIAAALMGDSIASNLFLLGFSFQKGLIPVSEASVLEAIELNNVAVKFNQQAFLWGRRAGHDAEAVTKIALGNKTEVRLLTDLDDIINWRVNYLTEYQDADYANQYLKFVEQIRAAEQEKFQHSDKPAPKSAMKLTIAVARYYFKLMAYKDEYEVGRLYTNGKFEEKIAEKFEGDFKLQFHLAPPLFSRKDKSTGHLRKGSYSQWTFKLFAMLARLKFLRGTKFDVFGYTQERKNERELIVDYRKTLESLMSELVADNYEVAVEIATLPKFIRGYGHVKENSMTESSQKQKLLMNQFYGKDQQVVPIIERVTKVK